MNIIKIIHHSYLVKLMSKFMQLSKIKIITSKILETHDLVGILEYENKVPFAILR